MRLYLLILLIFDPLLAQSPFRNNAVAETGWNVVFGTDPGSGNMTGERETRAYMEFHGCR